MKKQLLIYLLFSTSTTYTSDASVKKTPPKMVKISNINTIDEVRAYTEHVIVAPDTPTGAVKGMVSNGLTQRELRMLTKMLERRSQTDLSAEAIPVEKTKYLAGIPWTEEDSDDALPQITRSLYKYTKTTSPVFVKPYQDFTLLAIATLDHSGKPGCDPDLIEKLIKESILHGSNGYDEIMLGKRKDDGSVTLGIKQDLDAIIVKTEQKLHTVMQAIHYLKVARSQRDAHIKYLTDMAQKAKLIKQNELLTQKIDILQEDVCNRILVQKQALRQIAGHAEEEMSIVKIIDAENMEAITDLLRATHRAEDDSVIIEEEDGISA